MSQNKNKTNTSVAHEARKASELSLLLQSTTLDEVNAVKSLSEDIVLPSGDLEWGRLS